MRTHTVHNHTYCIHKYTYIHIHIHIHTHPYSIRGEDERRHGVTGGKREPGCMLAGSHAVCFTQTKVRGSQLGGGGGAGAGGGGERMAILDFSGFSF